MLVLLLKEEYFGIGSIKFQDIKVNVSNKTSKESYSSARPLLPFVKEYPLVNEYVVIFQGPSPDNPGATAKPNYYYISLKLWNDNEQNASPDPISVSNNLPSQSNKSYTEIESGSPRVSQKTTTHGS